jgi:hypothetical protein
LGRAVPDLAAIRDAWRLCSLADGWRATDDWHNGAVDAVAEAMLTGALPGALSRACESLGRARAQAGVGVAEAIADFAALYAVLDRGTPPLHLVSSIAEGWAEEGLARHSQGQCEDPLTGLTTIPYLRTRLTELYRAADQLGSIPASTHRLVVVRLPRRPDPWRRMAADILLGHDLRATFPGGTLAQSPLSGAGFALVVTSGDFPARCARLRRVAELGYGARTRTASLPVPLTEALRLVDELAH